MNDVSTTDPVDHLAAEFVDRYRKGERPTVGEYAARCPERAEEIRDLFPALVVMESLKPGDRPSPTAGQSECAAEVASLGRLGDYRIIREIGRGGMGIVYEAYQESLGRRVALKVLPRQLLPDDARRVRFEREARSAARLHHTNIVPVFGIGEENRLHYYAMQYIHGLGLDKVLLELKAQRERSGSRSGSLPAAAEHEPAPITVPPPAAVELTQSLVTGRFAVAAGSSELPPETSGAALPPRAPASAALAAETVTGQLSDTASVSKNYCLPGDASKSSRSPARSTYFQSVARIGVQVAEALQHAHEQGVLHRDIKPSNLLLDSRGVVWVTDFGLAKAEDQRDLTHTGDALGTLRYMPPEAFNGQTDRRSDLYSLGLTLYELLAMRPAFAETDRARLIRQVMLDCPPRLRQLDPSIPRDLEIIVQKSSDRDPAHRYQTAQELADDLFRFLNGEPIWARRISFVTRFRRWCQRNPAIVSLTSAIVVLLVAAFGAVAASVGWAVRDRSARQAMAVHVAAQALVQSSAFLESKHWSHALTEAQRAETALASGATGTPLRQQVAQRVKDVLMVQRLEQIRLAKSALDDQAFDFRTADTSYRQAFLDFGIDFTQATVEEAAAFIQTREIAEELTIALDDWASARRSLTEPAGDWKKLVAVAQHADRDPVRNGLREIWIREATEDVDQRLLQMVEAAPVNNLPPATLFLLGRTLKRAGLQSQELSVLQQAQRRFPTDFWLNFSLAYALSNTFPSDVENAIRYYSVATTLRPEAAMAHNNLAAVLLRRGRVDEAVLSARQALECDPRLALAHANLGQALSSKGQSAAAIESCRKAVELNGKSGFAREKLGAAWEATGNIVEATACYRQAIEVDPSYAFAYDRLGLVLEREGKLAEAVATYRQAIERDGKGAQFHLHLGWALRKSKLLEESIRSFRRAVELDARLAAAHTNLGLALTDRGDYEEALDTLRRGVELNPQSSMAYTNLGYALIKTRQFDEAINCQKKAIQLDPVNALAHGNLGVALREKGRIELAIASLRRAIEIDPNQAPAHYGLGLALGQKGLTDSAIECYAEAIRLAPDFAVAHNGLGLRLQMKGQHEAAIACFRKAIELDPKFSLAMINLGDALLKHDDIDEAASCFRRAIEVESRSAPAHNRLGICFARQGALEQAMEHYRRAITLDGTLWQPQLNLALAFERQGKTREAIEYFRAVVARNPGHALAHAKLAWYLATSTDQDLIEPFEAVVHARQAVKLDPNDAKYWSNLGVAQYRLGRFEDASTNLQKANDMRQGGDLEHRFFLAMTYWQLGQRSAALDAYHQALNWLNGQSTVNELQSRFRSEAAALLQID